MNRPTLLDALDLLSYWREAVAYLLSEGWSYRRLAQRLSLGAPNAVQRISDEKRPLQREVWLDLGQELNWDETEIHYADLLWQWSKSSDHVTKDRLYAAMADLRRQRQVTMLEDHQYAFFRHWYMPVIWELAVHPECQGPQWIADQIRPKLDLRRVRSALESLVETGMLMPLPAPQRGWARGQSSVQTPARVRSTAVARYHADVLQLAEVSIESWSPAERDLRTAMVGLSEKRYQILKNRLQEVWQEVLGSVPEDEPVERVCQVSFQLYPYTRPLRKS